MKFKYNGPDSKKLGRFEAVGHGSVLEISQAEVLEIDGTLFERVHDSTPASTLALGSIPYVPDVTALSKEETAAAASLARSPSMEAAGGTPGPKDKHGRPVTEKESDKLRAEAAKEEDKAEKERQAAAAKHPQAVTSTGPTTQTVHTPIRR